MKWFKSKNQQEQVDYPKLRILAEPCFNHTSFGFIDEVVQLANEQGRFNAHADSVTVGVSWDAFKSIQDFRAAFNVPGGLVLKADPYRICVRLHAWGESCQRGWVLLDGETIVVNDHDFVREVVLPICKSGLLDGWHGCIPVRVSPEIYDVVRLSPYVDPSPAKGPIVYGWGGYRFLISQDSEVRLWEVGERTEDAKSQDHS